MGFGNNDDAAVLRIPSAPGSEQAIVQTVDFFTPIVDDPYLFGAIAAANSVSDVYAMGATPILGLAIAAFPTGKLPLSTLEAILKGGAEKAAEAGFPIGGGHTIIDDVPKYGLAVTGIVDVAKIVRNSTAKPGDFLYLTKPIGNGILISAHRALSGRRRFLSLRRPPLPSLDEAINWMTRLNRDAAAAMVDVGVNAATDVTGYGLAGHLLEMCEGSKAGAEIQVSAVPLLDDARLYLARGYRPEGSVRNMKVFRSRIDSSVAESDLLLMCDAQTSGGLLMAVSPDNVSQLEQRFDQSGLFYAKIGSMTDRSGVVRIVP